MNFGILGPLLFCTGDDSAPAPSAPKPRQLLALLLINANRTVSADYCIEELWEGDPPPSAAATLQTYVMQIRKSLSRKDSTSQRLLTRERGYRFVMETDEFDVDIFESRVRRARAVLAGEDDVQAGDLLREALSVWRGPVFADVSTGPVLQMWATSLNEARLAVLENRIEVDLRLGRHRELIGELSGMVQRSPLLESLHAHLIIALYRSGRQVHALQVYERLRHKLAAELGLEPTPELQHLHTRVLRSDPELSPPPATPSDRFSAELIAGRMIPDIPACVG